MALSSDLISQFVKATQDKDEPIKETTAYGKIVVKDGKEYVQLDGSELLTPVSTTTVVNDEDRVIVTIKNHTAIVTGDLTNPSASNKEVTEIGNKITEFEILIGDKVTTEQLEAEIARIEKLRTEELDATNAKIETLEGKVAKIDEIEADMIEVSGKITATEAEFDTLRADIADFKDVTADRVDAVEGKFNTLESDYADFEQTTTTKLNAAEANITKLQTEKLDTETANAKYATIDFSNIGEAAIEKLFSDSGIIKDLIMSDGKVTGELVGVTIKGDIIEGNTVKADKLVILGEDGLYYKLNVDALGETTASADEKYQNGLDGSVILAESITAEKIAVDDLVAFGATIGGFHINEHAIYSGVKESMTNTTPGIHMTDDGQVNIGDSNNFLKYYVDEDGKYKLEIQADSLKFGSNGTTIEQYIENAKEPISKTIEGYPLIISDGVKVIDFEIDGKSEQIVTEASSNICPPITDSRWILENGAYLDSDGTIHLPELVSKASITVPWNKRSNKMLLIYTVASGGNALINTVYLDENKAMISGNGSAIMDKPDGYIQNSYFGGENIYGDALAQAKYVVVIFQRNTEYTPNPYTFKDVSISISDSAYTPFIPDAPSMDDPSEIKSIGYENLFDGVFEQGTFNYNNGTNLDNSKVIRTKIFKIQSNTTYTFSMDEALGEFACAFFRDENVNSYISGFGKTETSKKYCTFTTPTNAKYVKFRVGYPELINGVDYGKTIDTDYRPQLVKGAMEKSFITHGKSGIEIINRSKNYIAVLGNKPEGTTETINGITYTVLEDGRIRVNGTATAKSVFYIGPDLNIPLDSGIRTISGGSANIGFQVAVNNNGTYVYPTCYGTPSSFTYTNPIIRATCLVVAAGKTVNNEIVYIQFEDGIEATDYNQHFSDSTLLELNEPLRSLPNGVKDVVLVKRGKVSVIRRTGSIILNGSETWYNYPTGTDKGYTYYTAINGVALGLNKSICSHFTNHGYAWDVGVPGEYSDHPTLTNKYFVTDKPTATEFKTWLAANNVLLVYELPEPVIENLGEVDIPMYKNVTNIYYINDDVDPDRMYCEYYTLYAERVADLDTDIDEVSASITIEAGKIVQEATNSINSKVTNIELTQNYITGEVEKLEKKVESSITEDDVTILISKELEKGVDKVTTNTGFTFNENGLNISKTGKLMDTTINENGMVIQRGDEDRLVANDEGVVAYNLHAKTYLVIGSSSRFEDYVKKTEAGEEPRTGCFWVGDIGGVY